MFCLDLKISKKCYTSNMSILNGKTVLVIGDESVQIKNLEKELVSENTKLIKTTCEHADADTIDKEGIDVIFLNHLHDGGPCLELLSSLKEKHISKTLPIFALVENDPAKIEHALMLGAADYFLPNETVGSIIKKIRVVLGEPENYFDESVIDVTSNTTPTAKSGLKVYLIEDDPLLRNLLSIRFEQAHYAYEYSSDGKFALGAMQKFKPNVVILDLMLPGQSGFDVLEGIRNDPLLKDTPVIVFSNRDGQTEQRRAKELCAKEFFVKAMTDLSDLVLAIERLAK